MSNQLGAILIGAAVAGAAVLLLRRSAKAPSSTELSACEKAAALAEKAQQGAGAAVLAGCALLNSNAGKMATGTITGTAKAIGCAIGVSSCGGPITCPAGQVPAYDWRAERFVKIGTLGVPQRCVSAAVTAPTTVTGKGSSRGPSGGVTVT